MHPNIDIVAGLCSFKNAFDQYPDPHCATTEILKLLELSLKCNDFVFYDQMYQQIKALFVYSPFLCSPRTRGGEM